MSASQEVRRRLPQLEMRRSDLDGLPSVALPSPYRLRTYRLGDESAYAAIMNTGIGKDWTAESVRSFLIDRPQFDPRNLFFVTFDGEPVGTACAWRLDPNERRVGYLHMVCVRPEHRGHGLGYWLTVQVLHRFKELGFSSAMLRTDDFRLAAIRQYLRLGFRPECTDPSHPDRWATVLASLREPPCGSETRSE